jgi:hypothetical protein
MKRGENMVYQLLCDDEYKAYIRQCLSEYGMSESLESDLLIVEKGVSYEADSFSMILILDMSELSIAKQGIDSLFGFSMGECNLNEERIIGKIDDKYGMIEYDTIKYFSANSNDVYFHADQTYHCKEKLYELEKRLRRKGFIRINKSEIVNIKMVRSIVPWFNNRLVLYMPDDLELVVTKSYTKAFKEYIGF